MKQLLKKYTLGFTALAFVAVATGAIIPAAPALASVDPSGEIESGLQAAGGGSASEAPLKTALQNLVNALFFILGAIAVVVIIIGGIRYTASNGDSNQITAAKNTILYAVIGLIVALIAYAVVSFVIQAFA